MIRRDNHSGLLSRWRLDDPCKKLSQRIVDDYKARGELPRPRAALTNGGVSAYGSGLRGRGPAAVLNNFLTDAKPGTYVGIQAYVQPTSVTDKSLLELRERIRDDFRLATTVGYGPRFLHSTGQLHKGGGPGRGSFVQITADEGNVEVPIPDELGSKKSSSSFGILMKAQYLGDSQALSDADQRVMRIHVKGDLKRALDRLSAALLESSGAASRTTRDTRRYRPEDYERRGRPERRSRPVLRVVNHAHSKARPVVASGAHRRSASNRRRTTGA